MSGTIDKLSDPICIKRSVKISGTLRIKRYKVYKDKCNIVNVVLNIHRNHKAYYGRGEGGEGYGGGGRGRVYTYRYTVTPPITPAPRAILMFH